MLILGRREGEEIIVNGDLIIKVCTITSRYNQVRLGFHGSKKDYTVDRVEVHKRKYKCVCQTCGAPR